MNPKLISLTLLVLAFGAMAYASRNSRVMTDDAPQGWFRAGDHPLNYEMIVDTAVKHSGKAGAHLKFTAGKAAGFGTLMQIFKADNYRGKRLRMSAWMRTENADSAQLWLRLDSAKSMVGFDNMDKRAVIGTTDWKKYELTLDVPAETVKIAFGVIVSGKGQVWVDDFAFEAVGKDVPSTNMLTPEQMKEEHEPGPASEHPAQPVNLDFETGVLTAAEQSARLAQEKANAEAARKWLEANAIRLNTVEAGDGFADMQPLKKMIGKARIVSLGEATHGTREFFQLKHRMLEFLATEMGFTIFSIEANMPEAYRLNDYVLNGNGDPAKLIRGMYFWTWDTQEVLDMVLWMREFNKSGKGRVQFTGFDMQAPNVAAGIVKDFVAVNDADYASKIISVSYKVTTTSSEGVEVETAKDTKADEQKLASNWKELVQHLEASREAYAKKGVATRDIEWAIQNARVVLQSIQMRTNEVSRDRSMADNVKWILDNNPDARIVLWAHNGHVSTGNNYGYDPMGASLRQMFGDRMVVFGFAFNRGSFQAMEMPFPSQRGLRNFTVDPAPEGSLDALLATAGLRIAAIDLRKLPKQGQVAKWFGEPRATKSIGAGYGEQFAANFLDKQVASKNYDALLFVETTTAARGLPRTPAK